MCIVISLFLSNKYRYFVKIGRLLDFLLTSTRKYYIITELGRKSQPGNCYSCCNAIVENVSICVDA